MNVAEKALKEAMHSLARASYFLNEVELAKLPIDDRQEFLKIRKQVGQLIRDLSPLLEGST